MGAKASTANYSNNNSVHQQQVHVNDVLNSSFSSSKTDCPQVQYLPTDSSDIDLIDTAMANHMRRTSTEAALTTLRNYNTAICNMSVESSSKIRDMASGQTSTRHWSSTHTYQRPLPMPITGNTLPQYVEDHRTPSFGFDNENYYNNNSSSFSSNIDCPPVQYLPTDGSDIDHIDTAMANHMRRTGTQAALTTLRNYNTAICNMSVESSSKIRDMASGQTSTRHWSSTHTYQRPLPMPITGNTLPQYVEDHRTPSFGFDNANYYNNNSSSFSSNIDCPPVQHLPTDGSDIDHIDTAMANHMRRTGTQAALTTLRNYNTAICNMSVESSSKIRDMASGQTSTRHWSSTHTYQRPLPMPITGNTLPQYVEDHRTPSFGFDNANYYNNSVHQQQVYVNDVLNSSSSSSSNTYCPPVQYPRRDRSDIDVIWDNYSSIDEVSTALRQLGLESSNLIVGVDFTKSNEWTGQRSFHRQSLHDLEHSTNPYEQALRIIGNTLTEYDEDNLIPCFGFGNASTQDKKVFSFKPNGEPCRGFDDVLHRYREIVPNVKLAGPTSFAPIIETAIQIVENNDGNYHVLLVITDGQVTQSVNGDTLSPQEKETVDAIVKASKYALSIVFIGVGDGPWYTMQQFDDNLPERAFDNFQFVNFTEIMSRNIDQRRKEVAFSLAALMEIPFQYQAILHLNLHGRQGGAVTKKLVRPPPSRETEKNFDCLHDDGIPFNLGSEPSLPPIISNCQLCNAYPNAIVFDCGHQSCANCGESLVCPWCQLKLLLGVIDRWFVT